MLTDTTPARVEIAGDSQLKDRRILFPDPGSPTSRLTDLFAFIFGSRASKGVPGLPRAQAASWAALRSSRPVLALPVRRLPVLSEGNC